jgi:hypothetical protein
LIGGLKPLLPCASLRLLFQPASSESMLKKAWFGSSEYWIESKMKNSA